MRRGEKLPLEQFKQLNRINNNRLIKRSVLPLYFLELETMNPGDILLHNNTPRTTLFK